MGLPYNYIRTDAVYDKLKRADSEGYCLYLHGPTGIGKTAAVRAFYEDRDCRWLTGISGELDKMPRLSEISEKTIIIDDVSWLTDEESTNYICMLAAEESKRLVLIGRSKLPSWLMKEYAEWHFLQSDEWDFLLNREQTVRFFGENDYKLSEAELQKVMQSTRGYALELVFLLPQMIRAKRYSDAVLSQAKTSMWHYYDKAVFEPWNENMRRLLLSVSEYESFTVDFAQMLTGIHSIEPILEYAYNIGDFLRKNEDGSYSLRSLLKEYLIYKQPLVWQKNEWTDLHKKASVYFECHDNLGLALRESKKIGDNEQVVRLLIKNSERHAGAGEYYDMREFYFSLPEETIEESPALIAGMSLLYSLLLQPEQSEIWYQKLVAFRKEHKSNAPLLKETKARIAYLDLSLPQKGTNGVSNVFKKIAAVATTRNMDIPEVSVTGNQPSVMNGGKDFCEWSKHDKELAIVFRKPIEIALGKSGVGLVDISLAESYFEKASADDYEISALLGSGYAAAEARGRIEICFAAIGVMTRLHISHNELRLANEQLADFEKKVIAEKKQRLMPNLRALRLLLGMRSGDVEQIKDWIRTAPNEAIGFFTLDRYMYLVKLRAYIALEEYNAAITLSHRLEYYFTEYERNYMRMENLLLRAICCYRMGLDEWKELFEKAYNEAKEYHFVRLISEEGIAVLPLLKAFLKDQELSEFDSLVKRKTEYMAFNYPLYMTPEKKLIEPLTETERQILQLHSSGMSTKEITDVFGFSERTLKFHNGNIYRKLGVAGKTEAIRAAERLGLVN